MQFDISKKITREEIQEALKNYQERGGRIQILPPQQTFDHSFIGGGNWGPYEDVESLLYSN